MRLSALKPTSLLLACLVLSACGSVSGLTRESSDAPQRIADYGRVDVGVFEVDDL
jgi:predicted small secreted protein